MNPRPLKEWGLSDESLKKVKKELKRWLNHLNTFSDNKTDNIKRCDFIKMKFFYFTDCTDLIAKEIESKGVELSLKVRKRKMAKLTSMLLETILGTDLNKKLACSHCGFDKCFIDGLSDGSGHYQYCPKCGKTVICTYPNYYDTCIEKVRESIEVEYGKGNTLLR